MKKMLCCLLALLLLLSSLGGMTVLAISDEDAVQEEEALPEVVGTRLSLTENFLVRFYFRLPEGGHSPYAYVDGVIHEARETEEPGLYEVIYEGLAVDAMVKQVKMIPVCRVEDKNLQGLPYYFSVRDYAMRLLVQDDLMPELRRVLVAMLNFGAAAQLYNQEQVYNLANDYLSAEDKIVPTREYNSVLAAHGKATQYFATITQASLVVNDSACLKIYVNLEGQEQLRVNGGTGFPEWQHLSKDAEAARLAKDVWAEVADNPNFENASVFPLEKIKTMDCYRVVSSGIYANRYSDSYYIRVCTPTGVSQTLQYGAETYVARNLNASDMTEEGRKMVIAMIAYGDAVLAYEQKQAA